MIMVSVYVNDAGKSNIKSLRSEERQRFGKLVHNLRKQGKSMKSAQELAYSMILLESIPFERG